MTQLQDKVTVQRNYVTQLLEQLTIDYQNTRSERRNIAEQQPVSPEEFTLLEELEWLTVSIRGYASQIKAMGRVENCEQAIAQLHQLNMFNHPVIAQLYLQARSSYPLMQSYIRMLDYLRLLVLEYLQMHQNVQPILAK